MSALDRLTKSEHIVVSAREIDFVTRFANNWEALREILGIMRPIKKTTGAVLKSKYATVTLQSGSVAEGDIIPNSQATVAEKDYAEMTLEKYKKSVSIEAIKDHGYDVAVGKTDDQFLYELQSNVMSRFYTYINGGYLGNVQTTFQSALAMAKGLVVNKWKKMHKTATGVVGFVNVLDVYEYLGAASITVQTAFGFEYLKDFMGFNTVFLLSDDEIPRGKVIATPIENIVLYYVDPATSDFIRAGLQYTVDGETNLIGFHTEGTYDRAVSDCYAIMGMVLFAEYIDGIAVVTVEASGSLGSISGFSTAAGATAGTSLLTVPDPSEAGATYWFKSQASTAPAAPTYLAQFDTTGWTKVVDEQTVAATNTHKYRVVEVNGSGQAIATADGTVTAKT